MPFVGNNIRRTNLKSMKTKIYKILGVALVAVLLASLTVGLAIPAGAVSSNLKWVKLELPKVEAWSDEAGFADAEGDFWCTPGIDLGPIAQTPDGEILFAAVADGIYLGNNWFHVLKSTDGGYSWTVTGFYEDAEDEDIVLADKQVTPIVDIVASPEYSDDTTLFVATEGYVYISDDGGKNFTQLSDPWGSSIITDMDVTIAEDGDTTIMVGTMGDVYVAKGLLSWTAQAIGYNVFACKFLPTFADDGDIGICAIVSDGSDTAMRFSFANIADGGEWGDDIADAPFTNAYGIPFGLYTYISRASIAFPDDFDAFGTGNNVCFAGLTTALDMTDPDEENGSDAYRVVLKEAGTSTAVDLDVRGVITTLLPTATPVTSIDVCGDAEAATILVGVDNINLTSTPAMFSVYISDDSGDSFAPAAKCPTGGAEYTPNLEYGMATTRVLMAPDFATSGLAYAATWGYMTDAFQRTTDGGESWNQISIIDYGWDFEYSAPGYYATSNGFSANGYNAAGTLYMTTSTNPMDDAPPTPSSVQVQQGALWGLLDGKHWERLLSYATPGVTDQLHRLDILGDGSAMFATDLVAGEIWRSTDMGATFPKKISTKTPLTTVAPVSATTLYTGSVGEIWWSTRSGTGWTKPDDSEIPSVPVINIGFPGADLVLVGTIGGVYISSNGGETVEKVGTDSPFGGVTIATSDLGFAGNGVLYATSPTEPVDVMRTSVDLANPGDAEWIQIDDNQDSTGTTVYDEGTFAAGGPAIALPPCGVLYVIDAAAVDTSDDPDDNAGGLWRSTNATADTDSVVPPYFERANKGLDGGEMLGLLSLDLKPPTLAPTFFCKDGTVDEDNYYEQIWMYTDILNVGATLVDPAADAVGVGLLPEGYVYPEVSLYWQEMAGATGYQYQLAIDAAFKTSIDVPKDGYTKSLASPPLELHPNQTYYWRVRAADTLPTTLLGAPLISPWSATFKFKTAIGASMARPQLQAPWPGEPGVSLSPTFEWSGIEWAEVYEFELAIDPATTAGGYFTTPLVAHIGTDSLVSTAWKSDTTLEYNSRYYWHVKAIGVDTDTPWSDVGTFTTLGVPPPPPTDGGGIIIPPVQNITPAWIWAIVIIGAILVIAVIVLIVTTRRVP